MEEAKRFGERLKALRAAAGLSQRELADRVGVSFTYISKLENGAMRIPSEQLIERLATVLSADKDELLTLAGKIPADILEMLKNQQVRRLLRSPRMQRKFRASSRKGGGIAMNLRGMNFGGLVRVATAVTLVVAIGASLWLSSPGPARAFNITASVSNSPISGSKTYLLGEKVTIPANMAFDPNEFKDLEPDAVTLSIAGVETFTKSLPIEVGNYTYGANQGVPGNLEVGVSWDTGITQPAGYANRYGYGYNVGNGKIRYNLKWKPPYVLSTPPPPPPPALPGMSSFFDILSSVPDPDPEDWNMPANPNDANSVKVASPSLDYPQGITASGSTLYILVPASYTPTGSQSAYDVIVKFSLANGTYQGWFAAPGNSWQTEALTFVGSTLYAASNTWGNNGPESTIYKRETSGAWSAIQSLSGLNFAVGGMTSDGTNLFLAYRDQLKIEKRNVTTGALIGSIIDLNNAWGGGGGGGFMPPPMWGFDALAYDDGVLFPGQGETILAINASTGAKTAEYKTNQWGIRGLQFVGVAFGGTTYQILHSAITQWPGKVYRSSKSGNVPVLEQTPIGEYTATFAVNASGQNFQQQDTFTVSKKSVAPAVTISSPLNGFALGAGQANVTVTGSIDDPSITQVSVGIALPNVTAFSDDVENAQQSNAKWQHSSVPTGNNMPWIQFSPDDLWHRSTLRNHTPNAQSASWRYGNASGPNSNNFDTPGLGNSGALRSINPIAIGSNNTLSFWTWYDTELDFWPDRKFVEVSTDGNNWTTVSWLAQFWPPFTPPDIPQQQFNKLTMVQPKQWTKVDVSLTDFAGQQIYLRFRFDSWDNINNFGEGWYIDDVSISGAGFQGVTANVDQNLQFSAPFTLAEGSNTITATAARTAYAPLLQGEASVTGSLDTAGPFLTLNPVTSPTNNNYQVISGNVVETNFQRLEITDNDVVKYSTSVLPANGNFAQGITLVEGNNNIVVTVTDKVGLSTQSSALIKLDTTGPVFEDVFTSRYDIAYKTGETSARPGDWFFIALKVTDAANQVASVKLQTPNQPESQWPSAMLKTSVPDAVIDSWGIKAASKAVMNYVLPMQLPAGLPAGNYTWTVKATDTAGNMSTMDVVTKIVTTLEGFNIYLMPDWNLVSTPLIPTNSSMSTLTQAITQTGLFERVWYYDASQAGTQNAWKFYDPVAGGDLTTMDAGKGYWFKMKNLAAFQAAGKVSAPMATGLPNTPTPIKLTIAGQVLQPGAVVPPTYPVVAGWNLIGLHSEVDRPVTSALRSVSVPTYKWASVFQWSNYIFFPMEQSGTPQIVLGKPESLELTGTMQPGRGFWLFMVEAGTIVP
ncbi:MAG: helix-turn-helix domain-containing protein [Chloroflexi bacterium]|nr:helix-turn-helix domain-containing protein [Chloroflexota bacterium]